MFHLCYFSFSLWHPAHRPRKQSTLRFGRNRSAPAYGMQVFLECASCMQLQWKEMIGSGAHGDVYRGVWKTLRVAIKSITFNGPQGSAALEDYATSQLSCVHANIVKTLQCFVRLPFCSCLPVAAVRLPGWLCRHLAGWRWITCA